ncbi:MAG: YceI family protein [Proteobacteria bacterium]|nr:YceI family protein [Pseudomonadota bacterium]MCP4919983.1 YceI family protein [Pseudomonadota bacterium]
MMTLLLPLFASSVEAAPVTYSLKGSLYVQVYKDPTTIAQALAHDHVVQAAGWTGTATWDPEDPAACAMDITVPVDKLVVDEESIRKRLGYDTFPSEGERADIRDAMLDDDVLGVSKYTTITWKLTGCELGENRTTVTGDMTIHGTSQSLTLPMSVKADSVNFSAKGNTKITSSQFGMPPFSAGFGALKNQDKMTLVVDIHGKPE